MSELAKADEYKFATPDVTPTQYGAGGIFLAVALACLGQGIAGDDLIAYLVSSALVSTGLVIGDALIRNGRARGSSVRG